MIETFKAYNVSKQYINHKALDNVSLSVPEQSICGLLGPNGAGKTTFIRIVNQIIAADTGELYFKGEKLKPRHIAKIGYLPEERGLYKKMKVGEQALYLAQLKDLDKQDAKKKLIEWFEKFDLKQWWNKKIEDLSKGMQQKVQFIVTILHKPDLLIFDEPFSGFDPINVNLLKKEILKLRDEGATVIFSTHNMASVEELCDHIILIDKSKKVLEGEVDVLKQNFKPGIFELSIAENGKIIEQYLPDDFSLINKTSQKGICKARIKIPGNISSNGLLKHFMQHFEIKAFNEVMPTMNDIFMETVNKNSDQEKGGIS